MQQLKVLHNVNSVGITSFGFGQIAVSLAKAQYDLGHDVKIWCLDNLDGIKWASATHSFPADRILGFKLTSPKVFLYSHDLNVYARRNVEATFDIVHQHGLWSGASIATLKFCRKGVTPTIIAPHGTLNPWALNHSSLKKRIALKIFESANLKLASCLHATSMNEISDFRNLGLNNPIAYIENGISEKRLISFGNADRFKELNGVHKDKRILLFLSRISPKKGLPMLIDAINSIRQDFLGWQLIIAGVDEFNHSIEVTTIIKEFGLGDQIKIIGPLFGQEKDDAFAAAELFVLPSLSEGSPLVILDSLIAGVPVITTKSSTWKDLVDYNCGWWTEIQASAIAVALKEAVSLPPKSLQSMGVKGKELIESKYTWTHLGQKTIQLYSWLLGKSDKPDFVNLD